MKGNCCKELAYITLGSYLSFKSEICKAGNLEGAGWNLLAQAEVAVYPQVELLREAWALFLRSFN